MVRREDNLRGATVVFNLGDGRDRWGEVITHIRDDRWLIEARRILPKKYQRGEWSRRRVILHRKDFTWVW